MVSTAMETASTTVGAFPPPFLFRLAHEQISPNKGMPSAQRELFGDGEKMRVSATPYTNDASIKAGQIWVDHTVELINEMWSEE